MKNQDLTVVIVSPRGRWETTVPKTTKVADLIDAARQHFGFEPDVFLLQPEGSDESLASERPLVSFGITDGAVLRLIPEMGRGV